MEQDIDTIYFPEDGPKKQWKQWQELYHSKITVGASSQRKQVVSDEKVDNAMLYVISKPDYDIQPAISRIRAIVYASTISQLYGEDFYATLDDANLFFGKDEHFAPYSEDRKTYDAIFDILQGFPNWAAMGSIPLMAGYCHMECTKEGIEKIISMLCE